MKKAREDQEGFLRKARDMHSSPIATEELVTFLINLARTLRNPRTGNVPLSDALLELASSLRDRVTRPGHLVSGLARRDDYAKKEHLRKLSAEDAQRLQALDGNAVERFIDDEKRTKIELMNLASARFAISKSRLLKMSVSSVRETIRSALLHERSLKILSQEAKRGGSQRSS